jgi:hypothetical protein
MIQPVPKSNKEEKSITRQVNLAVKSPPATTEYLHWSEEPIEFSRDDHPITVPRPGNEPLVLKAQIGTYGVREQNKSDIRKNTPGNAHIIRVSKANRLFLPRDRPREC